MSGPASFYLRSRSGVDALALFDQPAEAPAGPTGVLIVPPWGWDEVASYRSRRAWAERLAAAGHPTLRIDLPGTGDSAGDPETDGLVDLWVGAIEAGVEWLRGPGEAERVAMLGIGLGALLAEEALGRGVVAEELVCWGAPAGGRHFVRESKAFAGMQADRPIERDRHTGLPEGWLEAGGFVLSPATQAALKGLKAEGSPSSGRALLLGRDGVEDLAGRERLEARGVAVDEDPGSGWGGFVGHPETTELPAAVEEAVSTWLALAATEPRPDGEVASRPASPEGPPSAPTAIFSREGNAATSFVEEPLSISAGFGDAFGVLARPEAGGAARPCTVFLNAGAVRHIGPNRMWTEAARALAATGSPSLRVDLESIGEADGDPARRADVADFYDAGFVAQVTAVLDELERRGVADRFRLVGLCAGAYWAFRTALVDERVELAVLINSGALVWHPGILAEREGRRIGRAFQRHWWGRLLRGEIRLMSVLRLIGQTARGIMPTLSQLAPGAARGGRSPIAIDLNRLPPATRVLMAFSGGEPLREELGAQRILDQLDSWPRVEVVELPGSDHTLRSIEAQRAVAELLRRELSA
jgi:pimeloyl-ACP methyl ester carboxylesterase